MIALAKWVMQKPRNAIIGVALFSIIPLMFWLSGAILGLIVLRRGIKEGLPVFAWGALPAIGLWAAQGDATAFLVLLNVMILSYLLRVTMSWSRVLLVSSFIAVIGALIIPLVMPTVLELVVQLLQSVLDVEGVETPNREELFNQVVVVTAVSQVVMAVASLFLARKWQANLFNPGGLKQEFHQLRMPMPFALVLGGMVFLGESLDGFFTILSSSAIPVLVLCGIALVHGIIAKKEFGAVGLVTFYLVGFFILNVYFTNVLVALAVIDSIVDIRSRIQGKSSNSSES